MAQKSEKLHLLICNRFFSENLQNLDPIRFPSIVEIQECLVRAYPIL